MLIGFLIGSGIIIYPIIKGYFFDDDENFDAHRHP